MNQTFTVSGMTCQHCVARVQTALSSVTGVSSVNVSLMPPRATVEGEQVDFSALAAALAGTQFTLTDTPVITPKTIKR